MVLFRGAVFAAATASKAWEPLAVAVAGAGDTPYLFATALVLCEMGKLLLLLPFLALSPPTRHSRVSWFASATHYGVPALLLAVCNLCLGYAVPRLGALLYQIVFQVTTVFATGFAAAALLGQRLAAGQWAALALLTLGSLGASRSRLGSGRITNAPPSADGLVAALVGSVALSLSTVLSERTASTAGGALASRSVLHQAALMSAWGVAATAALLCVLHGPALLAGDASASPLAGFGAVAPWVVVGSIAAADLSMTVFCMVDGLGANAYSVSRCLAMVASPPLAALALDTRVSPGFAAASTVVAVGSYLFARYQPPVREDRQTYGRVLQDPHPESPGGVTT
jgi:drug/metabolite transporter (DMT)-like permease